MTDKERIEYQRCLDVYLSGGLLEPYMNDPIVKGCVQYCAGQNMKEIEFLRYLTKSLYSTKNELFEKMLEMQRSQANILLTPDKRPCPWCGGELEITWQPCNDGQLPDRLWYLECLSCGATSSPFRDERKVLSILNNEPQRITKTEETLAKIPPPKTY